LLYLGVLRRIQGILFVRKSVSELMTNLKEEWRETRFSIAEIGSAKYDQKVCFECFALC
jgi:hypothetical protein